MANGGKDGLCIWRDHLVAEHERAPMAPVEEALGQAYGLGSERGDWAEDQQVLVVVDVFVASYRLFRDLENFLDKVPRNAVSPDEGHPVWIETCHDTF